MIREEEQKAKALFKHLWHTTDKFHNGIEDGTYERFKKLESEFVQSIILGERKAKIDKIRNNKLIYKQK
jgi:hypothetical protein